MSEARKRWRKLLTHRAGMLGLVLVAAMVAASLLGPVVYSGDAFTMNVAERLQAPSPGHPLGTDEFGRDLLARILLGGRISLLVGVISVTIAGLAGTLLGLLAGYFGGRLDAAISAVVDLMLAFPGFLLALAVVATLGPSLPNAMIAIGIRRIPIFARVIRSAVLTVSRSGYVEAARALGARHALTLFRHVLPNVMSSVIVLATLQFPEAILTSAGLSFLGLGAQPPSPEWGALLVGARVYMISAPWVVDFPGLAIVATVLGFNLLGNALRDVFDPRLKGD